MSQTTRVSHDIASEAATHLGRCPTERGVDRLAKAIADRGNDAAGNVVRSSDMKPVEKLLTVAKLVAEAAVASGDGFTVPPHLMGALDVAITMVDPTVAIWSPKGDVEAIKQRIDTRFDRLLAAIDQGTKHEQTRAEFLADFNAKAEMEIHPFTPNPSKLAMDPALRELVAMDHDDTIERFSEEPDDTDE